ncbi:MAG: ribonuclease P protein component [Candidatus Rokuibacteriota bacterium]
MGERALPRSERLARADEFQSVFQGGRRVERPSAVILWRGSPGPRKAGFTVSRQVRGAARRNRARRRVREAYRVSRQALPAGGVRLVIVARPRAGVGPFSEILEDMREALAMVAKGCRQAARA